MTGEQIWGVVRTILAAVAGWLVAKGYATDELVQAVLGGVGTIFVAAWSFFSKKPAA
ncbi:hypothetical protein [Bradyrhizobium sp. SZCCHNRI1073]|uniref:Pam3-gp28 family putative phage holin n=1 Tax=Bradyrhizobium sp. SZCCHNRI1073 TaxID=3057280 RepID=UPI002915DF7A|nr:hypothetical protein [Bradyrhizobium sp. SZCCHNRI1073]